MQVVVDINPGDIARVNTGLNADGSPTGFKNSAGALTDPTTITLRWRVAGGTETTWVYGTNNQIVRDSAGIFHADIPIVSRGLHYFRWVGTGTVAAASEGTFSVGGYFVGLP